jgi:hypothetical protein
MVFENYKYYLKYIKEKYNYSETCYKDKLDDESPTFEYLMKYEGMNVYPAYPLPIIMPLPKLNNNIFDLIKIDKVKLLDNEHMNRIKKYDTILNKKIKEFAEYSTKFEDLQNTDKVRRYFSYEIVDKIKEMTKSKNITNAYIKMYEIMKSFDFCNNKDSQLNIFHICEHPGAFVFGTTDYIKNNFPDKKYNVIIQSLNPSINKGGFKPFPELLQKFKIDYGTKNTGDITDIDNIKYYINTYEKNKYNLITSDCGWDCSDDFTKQETKLMPIYFGTLITTIGLSFEQTDVCLKCFSFNSPKMIELLYLCSLIYENIYITRLLTDKSGSGEHYIIMRKLKITNNEKTKLIDLLIEYYKDYQTKSLFESIDNYYLKKVRIYSYLTTIRRITNYNCLIFRVNNNKFSDVKNDVKEYVKKFVYYYVDYYIKLIGLN